MPTADIGQLERLVDHAERNGLDGDVSSDIAAVLDRLRVAARAEVGVDRAAIVDAVVPLRDRVDALRESLDPVFADVLARIGVPSLHGHQASAIAAARAGRDVLVVAPTGSGKSLCYQAPGLAGSGLTIVVSPLVALINDQYERLRALGFSVRRLVGGQPAAEAAESLAAIRGGDVRLVFCAPERFAQASFLDAVRANRVDLFAVDEAHCVVDWGHDFRPEYHRLAPIRDMLGARVTMALTATATPATAGEIVRGLALDDPLVVFGGVDRPNIAFDVIHLSGPGSVAEKWRRLRAGLTAPDAEPAIVYCGTRRDVEAVADGLRDGGVAAVAYHAGMSMEARTAAQNAFMGDACGVIVATNAFGMGVDKPNVRSVWHWALPTSLEGYYQEAGRAGRDGAPARAVLLAMNADLGRLIRFITRDTVGVKETRAVLERFAADADAGGSLTVALEPGNDQLRLAIAFAERAGAIRVGPGAAGTIAVDVIHSTLDDAGAALVDHAAVVARDRRWTQFRAIREYAEGRECRRRQLMRVFGDRSEPSPSGRCCDRCDPLPPLPPAVPPPGTARRAAPPVSATTDPADERLVEALRMWRRERADGKPAYTVCNDRALRSIAATRPSSASELGAIVGIGPVFLERHAESLLDAVRDT